MMNKTHETSPPSTPSPPGAGPSNYSLSALVALASAAVTENKIGDAQRFFRQAILAAQGDATALKGIYATFAYNLLQKKEYDAAADVLHEGLNVQLERFASFTKSSADEKIAATLAIMANDHVPREDKQHILKFITYISTVLSRQEKYALASSYLSLKVDACQALEDTTLTQEATSQLATTYTQLGYKLFSTHHYQDAAAIFIKSKAYYQSLGNTDLASRESYFIGRSYEALGQTDDAKTAYLEAMANKDLCISVRAVIASARLDSRMAVSVISQLQKLASFRMEQRTPEEHEKLHTLATDITPQIYALAPSLSERQNQQAQWYLQALGFPNPSFLQRELNRNPMEAQTPSPYSSVRHAGQGIDPNLLHPSPSTASGRGK